MKRIICLLMMSSFVSWFAFADFVTLPPVQNVQETSWVNTPGTASFNVIFPSQLVTANFMAESRVDYLLNTVPNVEDATSVASMWEGTVAAIMRRARQDITLQGVVYYPVITWQLDNGSAFVFMLTYFPGNSSFLFLFAAVLYP